MLITFGTSGTHQKVAIKIIFDLMQCTRARYKYSIRYCRQHKNQIQADTIAGLLTRQKFSSFWKNVTRTMSRDLSYPFNVANGTGARHL